ncbi:MAG: flagellar biosynthesis protein FlhB [Gammaproteobacteria bacterium]|nr:MAG: flagellar biosynthesis protein FlhB [Gammaproteobacteria bacterium]
MAEERDGQERTEQPTEKRRRDARRKGQVPRSRELNTVLMLLVASGALLVLGDDMVTQLGQVLQEAFRVDRHDLHRAATVVPALGAALRTGFLGILPFLVLMGVVAVGASLALGGWVFSAEALAFRPEKLDPVRGLKRIFSARGAMELAKALVKFVLVGAVGVLLLRGWFAEMLGLGSEDVARALAHAGHLLAWGFVLLSASLVLVALFDVPFQLWEHTRQLKMTRQELRDELKDTEGKPEVRSRIRQLQQEAARRRMMEAVPEADVVITNPTHFAVALKYEEQRMKAPRVVAKGRGLVAQRIREIARAHDVPLFSAPPLARALYHTTELDAEIPAGLYLAVAQVLAYVYRLRATPAHARGGLERPEIEVPEAFRYDPE